MLGFYYLELKYAIEEHYLTSLALLFLADPKPPKIAEPSVYQPLCYLHRFGCGEGGGSVVLDIAMPITWSNLYVEFDNIGKCNTEIMK